MKQIFFIGAIVAVMALFFIPRYALERRQLERLNAAAGASSFPAVKVLRLQANTKPIELELPSYLEGYDMTPILARTNGYLKRFLVDIGDSVAKGQLLAEIETPEIDEEVVRAEASVASFLAKEEIAFITARRWTKLYEHNPEALSKEEVDQNIAAYKSAAADTKAAKANLSRLRFLQGFQRVYAPYDGIITKRSIDIGTLIVAGGLDNPIELFQMVRSDLLRAFVDVPQSHYYLIKDGLKAEASVWEYPGNSFAGIIDRNASALDPQARTLLTQVNIDNSSKLLLPGLYASVKFLFPPQHKTYLIPVGALIIRSGPPYVAVVESGQTIRLQEVKIGRDLGKVIEIIQGLSDDDEIVVNPTEKIQDKIRVIATPLSKEEEASLL